MSPEYLIAQLRDLENAIDACRQAKKAEANLLNNRLWICNTSDDAPETLERFVQECPARVPPFEYKTPPIDPSEEDDELELANKKIAELSQEKELVDKAIDVQRQALSEKTEELTSIKYLLGDCDREDAEIDLRFNEEVAKAQSATNVKNDMLRTEFEQKYAGGIDAGYKAEPLGCGRILKLAFFGFLLGEAIYLVMYVIIGVLGLDFYIYGNGLLAWLQIVGWVIPFAIEFKKRSKARAWFEQQANQKRELQNLDFRRLEQETLANNEELAQTINRLRQEAIIQHENNSIKKHDLQEKKRALNLEIEKINQDIGQYDEPLADISTRLEEASKNAETISSKLAKRREAITKQHDEQRALAFKEYLETVRPAFNEEGQKAKEAFDKKLEEAEALSLSCEAKVAELRASIACEGDEFPSQYDDFVPNIIEKISDNPSLTWKQAIEVLTSDAQKKTVAASPHSANSASASGSHTQSTARKDASGSPSMQADPARKPRDSSAPTESRSTSATRSSRASKRGGPGSGTRSTNSAAGVRTPRPSQTRRPGGGARTDDRGRPLRPSQTGGSSTNRGRAPRSS